MKSCGILLLTPHFSMKKEIIDKIQAQALQEIQHARTFKQGKTGNWALNELMYYGKAVKAVESRSSVQLSRMQEFVHTLLSKIDNPLVFKLTKRKNAQTKRVELLNALRAQDQRDNFWDIKDIVGKKQAIIYGRAIYSYYATSKNGKYAPHLDNVDVYDFLIDPLCGGVDIELARYLGDQSVILSKKQLRDGVKAKIYIKDRTEQLIQGNGNLDNSSQEETNKRQRTFDQNTTFTQKDGAITTTDFRFWRWCTTFEGERYYLLMTDGGAVIRCEPLQEVVPVSADCPEGRWPYWTWAAFLDLTEFWTPSYCDYAREILMAQDVTVNQMLDNAEAINKPQKVVNVTAIENMAELKYRRDGTIKVKGDFDVNKAYQTVVTPSIDTPLKVFELLETIQQKTSGVTDQTLGVSDEEGKVGIYQGNEAATADRFGLLNKSYSFGYERFARLWEEGVRDNLQKKMAVELLGPNGVEVKEVRKGDLFKKGDRYGVMVEASNAQMLASEQSREAKRVFLTAQAQNPRINQKKSFEIQAEIAGLTPDQIEQLLDVSAFGNSELMGECDRDIESLLNGEDIKPNAAANNAYKQRMVDYLVDHEEDVSMDQFTRIATYIDALEEVIMKNEARALMVEETNAKLAAVVAMAQQPTPMPGMPPEGGPAIPRSPIPAPVGAPPMPVPMQ